MGTGQKRNTPVVLQAYKALDQFKYEVANELGIDQNQIYGGYWGNLTSRDCGAVGGHMVRRMIEAAEQSLAQQALAGMKTGFQTGFNAAGTNLNQQNQQGVKFGTTPNPGNPSTYQ